MFGWKHSLLQVYYQATLPYRRRRNRQEASLGRAPQMIVLYHRIADDRANLWTTTTSAFLRQIEWMRSEFEFVTLAEIQRRLRGRGSERPAVHITFDDGYAVNCEQALPLLVREQIPCTYFVTAEPVLKGVPFTHDLVMGHRFAPNTMEQLQAMAAAGIEIGHHTRSHPDMGRVSDAAQLFDEIVASRDELQQALGYPIRYFAFPFGQHHRLSPAAFRLAYEAGYEAVVSAYGGYNVLGDDAFHLQRIPVDDSLLRLKNWLTVDPRKQRTTRRFYYGGVQRPGHVEAALS
ncbi:MAG: polysaccharide deacetylase family protein [Pirellulales bacterium]|nr:polysaccharide deacetylase family protein [Pirellulales bacterium]